MTAVLIGSFIAVLASSPDDTADADIFSGIPGPFLAFSGNTREVEYLITVQGPEEVRPLDNQWTEFFDVELVVDPGTESPVSGILTAELAEVSSDNVLVPPRMVTQVNLNEDRALILSDERVLLRCSDGVCIKRYYVRFSWSGEVRLEAEWFLRTGINWDNQELTPAETARLVYRTQRIQTDD